MLCVLCLVALRVDFLFFVSKMCCFFMTKTVLLWITTTNYPWS